MCKIEHKHLLAGFSTMHFTNFLWVFDLYQSSIISVGENVMGTDDKAKVSYFSVPYTRDQLPICCCLLQNWIVFCYFLVIYPTNMSTYNRLSQKMSAD